MKIRVLILGDALALLAVTLIGFAAHAEVELSALPRFGATYLPLFAGWLVIAPWLGLFQEAVGADLRQAWRPALAVLFAVPLAVLVRGLLLNEPVIPIFGVVLTLSCALAMTIWRAAYIFVLFRGLAGGLARD
jgi:hypothetical protein